MISPNLPQTVAKPNDMVFDTDEASFKTRVLERSHTTTVVVDFWAPWCGPCRTLGPMLERLAAAADGAWVLAKVNVDNNQRLAQMFGVQGIPAVKALRDGKLIDEFTGALPESQVRAWLAKLPKPAAAPVLPADALANEAAARAASDPHGAAARYREALAIDATHAASQLGLGGVLARTGDAAAVAMLNQLAPGTPLYAAAQGWLTLAPLLAEVDETAAFGLITRVEETPNDTAARFELALHQICGGRYDDAIEHMLAVVAQDRTFRDDIGRRVLLALLAALGDAHPAVGSARRQLATLLF